LKSGDNKTLLFKNFKISGGDDKKLKYVGLKGIVSRDGLSTETIGLCIV
jgi:hypothetical protein